MQFRSKVDAWLVLVLAIAAIVAVATAAVAIRHASGMSILVFVAIVALGAALPIWILVSTVYVVESGTLRIRSGPFAWRIPISSITSIKPTRSPLSSPAPSLDRLRVEYGAGKSIMISPADQQAFLRAIEGAKTAG
jgi:membrane protein YdbS with pleckstrin-like domain